METPRVLSIQSHVVSGYVGNKSATFPLQLLGFEVDAINSVQLSNHTGYGRVTGQVLTERDLGELADGLHANGLDRYTHVLTGYIGAESFLHRVKELISHLREVNPDIIYVCDPVMGDNGKMYVPESLLPLYKNSISKIADIITPNHYELQLLTDTKIETLDQAWKAIDILHQRGCKTVMVSSTELGNDQYLLALASTSTGSGTFQKAIIEIPKLPSSFTGTGDLFASLFLAWMYKTNNNLLVSLENTIATLQAVLKRTLQAYSGKTGGIIELKLIQSKRDIEEPEVQIRAQIVT